MMVTRKRRLPMNPTQSSAAKGTKSTNRAGPQQPPGPIMNKKQRTQSESLDLSSEDDLQMDTDKNASTHKPSDGEGNLTDDDSP